jgi:hypothetical protein
VSNPITEQILSAWDEDEELEGAEPVATETDPEQDLDEAPSDEVVADAEDEEDAPSEEEEEAPDEPGEEEAEDEEEPSEEEADDEESGDEELVSAAFSDDPQTKAFLARHGGSVESALRASMQFENVLGRQGRELGDLRRANAEMEAELEQARAFSQSGHFFSPEQQQWLEEAVDSENAVAYIQAAVQSGEYGLARAVLDQAEMPAGQVLRLAQAIDAAENQPDYSEPQVLNHQALLGVLIEHYPEMPQFEPEMVTTIAALGEGHPLVALSRSNDPGEAAQGIIGIYEIARAKTATVTNARSEVTKKRRQAADAARRDAQVTSATASPSQAQTPRQRMIMPGLSLEALEAEFDAE